MDPTQAIIDLINAALNKDHNLVHDQIEALNEWAKKGGFGIDLKKVDRSDLECLDLACQHHWTSSNSALHQLSSWLSYKCSPLVKDADIMKRTTYKALDECFSVLY